MYKFLKELRNMQSVLPTNTLKTIRGQALAGELDGARKGFATCKKRGVQND